MKSGFSDSSKADTVEAVVEGLSTDGRAVVRIDGTVFFVTGAMPGDRARLILYTETRPPSARVEKLLTPSEHRVAYPCPEAAVCHGSVWQVLAYQEQLRHKRDLVQRTLRKALGDVDVLPVIASPRTWHYRNRISLSVWTEDNHVCVGFQTEARHRAGIAIRTCHLAHELLLPALKNLSEFFADLRTNDMETLPRRIQIHCTKAGGIASTFAGEAGESDAREWNERLKDVFSGGLWAASGTHAGIADLRKTIIPALGALPMLTTWFGHDVELSPALFCQANGEAADLVHGRLRDLHSRQGTSRAYGISTAVTVRWEWLRQERNRLRFLSLQRKVRKHRKRWRHAPKIRKPNSSPEICCEA